jgi:hypothetical protein
MRVGARAGARVLLLFSLFYLFLMFSGPFLPLESCGCGAKGQEFAVKGQEFAVKGQEFAVKGQEFAVKGQEFAVKT